MSQAENDDIVCVACGAANDPISHFCEECGGPLTAHAVTDPFDVIKTQGWIYRKAAKGSQSPIVVIGIWLLLGPLFLGSLVIVFEGGAEFIRGSNFRSVADSIVARLLYLFFLIAACGLGVLLWRTTRNFWNYPGGRIARESDTDEDDGEAGASQ